MGCLHIDWVHVLLDSAIFGKLTDQEICLGSLSLIIKKWVLIDCIRVNWVALDSFKHDTFHLVVSELIGISG